MFSSLVQIFGLIGRSSTISFMNFSVRMIHKVSLNPDFLFSKIFPRNFLADHRLQTDS